MAATSWMNHDRMQILTSSDCPKLCYRRGALHCVALQLHLLERLIFIVYRQGIKCRSFIYLFDSPRHLSIHNASCRFLLLTSQPFQRFLSWSSRNNLHIVWLSYHNSFFVRPKIVSIDFSPLLLKDERLISWATC